MAACVNLLIAHLVVGVVHIDFWRKFSLVGMAFAPILQINILSLSGTLSFQMFFQGTSDWGLSWVKLDAIWKADLTKNRHLELGSHMNLSGLGVGGRWMERIATAESCSKASFMRPVFQLWVVWSTSWETIRSVRETTFDLGFGKNPWIQGTHGSCQTLMESPSLWDSKHP